MSTLDRWSHMVAPFEKFAGRERNQFSTKLEDIIQEIGYMLVTGAQDTEVLPKGVGDKAQAMLEMALMDEDERATTISNMLNALDVTHNEVLKAKHGDLIFPSVVVACRVFAKTGAIGLEDGLKAAIDKIKEHGASEARKAAAAAMSEQYPVMHNVAYKDARGGDREESMLTTAVYVLTEYEMVELEKAITERVEARLKSD